MMSLDSSEKVSINHHPLLPKTGNGKRSSTESTQRVKRKRYSVDVAFKGPAKRCHRANSDGQMDSILPTHFLLGGNIFDPLNLNSLSDEDINRATNRETQKCSPLPSRSKGPVEILVPRDITDPLNLKGGDDGVLPSPLKSRRRHRNRHGREKDTVPAQLFPSTDGLTVTLLAREGSVPVSPLPCELNTAITCREDVATPPILSRRHTHPPPGGARKSNDHRQKSRRRTTSTKSSDLICESINMTTQFQTPLTGGVGTARCTCKPVAARPPEKKDKHRYEYGNRCHYYGYYGFYGVGWEGRVGAQKDLRLRLLEDDWFRDKKVLDVGCGAGHLTLFIARGFNPAHILGVDLDGRLVHAAKQNIRHFLSHDLVKAETERRCSTVSLFSPRTGVRKEGKKDLKQKGDEDEAWRLLSFPLSLRVSRGPLAAPPLLLAAPPASCRFPNNISFIQGDYVSEQEFWPGRGQYDVIMCLGVTKWVQLQAGDGGVVRLFRRAYQSLCPSGLFILEPQPWQHYGRSKKASATTYHHYRSLQLRPEQFTSYLMDNVGFSSYRLLTHAGTQQPIYLFHKSPAHKDNK